MTDTLTTAQPERRIGDIVNGKVVVGIADAGLYLAPKPGLRVMYDHAKFYPGLK